MATMQEIRKKYPQYDDLSDQQLAEALHRKHYADMPFDQFASKVGLTAEQPAAGGGEAPWMQPIRALAGAAMSGADAVRGNAAEDLPSAVGSEAFRNARTEAASQRGYLDNLGREVGETNAAIFGNDEDLAKALAGNVPGAEITSDANGNIVIQLPSGERVYPNKPGLDAQDALRFAGNAASYVPAIRAARALAGSSLFARAGVTGGLTAGTNAGGQIAAGREQVDPVESVAAGGFGAAGEIASPMISRVIRAMSRSRASGNARAAEILRRDLGIEQPTTGQVQLFAQALEEIDAGANPAAILGADEFGFIYTQGRRLQDGAPGKFNLLSREEALRQDPGVAGNVMRGVDDQNRAALERTVQGLSRPAETAPGTPVEAFERVGERVRGMADELRGRVGEAYDRAAESGRAAISADAVRQVPERLQAALREFPADPRLTPATRATLDDIAKKAAGLSGDTRGVTLRAIEEQRRIINNSIGAAANPTDRAALRTLKAEYDRWLDDAFQNALISGDEQALAAMKEARGLRAEFARRFEGDADIDRFVAQMVEGERTPDELLGTALGASHVSRASAARFIERVRTATGADPEVMAAMKGAHLMRLLQGKNGETLGMQAIRNNILAAERETPSVIRSLYGEGEWAQVRRLAMALDPLVDKGTFARRPGTADQILRQALSLPFIGTAINAVRQPVNIGRAYGSMRRLNRAGYAAIPASAAAAGTEKARP